MALMIYYGLIFIYFFICVFFPITIAFIGGFILYWKKYKKYHRNKYFIRSLVGLIPCITFLTMGMFFLNYLKQYEFLENTFYLLIPCSIIGIIVSIYSALQLKNISLEK